MFCYNALIICYRSKINLFVPLNQKTRIFHKFINLHIIKRYIKPEDKARLIAFRNNPSDESWMQ